MAESPGSDLRESIAGQWSAVGSRDSGNCCPLPTND